MDSWVKVHVRMVKSCLFLCAEVVRATSSEGDLVHITAIEDYE